MATSSRRVPRVATVIWCLAILAALGACGSKSPGSPTPNVTSLAVTGTAPAIGLSSQFTATATLSDGSTSNVTPQASWQTANPLVFTVTNTGMVTGVGGGVADVSAIYQQIRGSTTVTIFPAVCVFSVQPQQVSVPNGGGSASVQIAFLQGPCPWSAQSNDAFITITSGASGIGNGIVTFSLAANPGPPRSGSLTVAGASITVSQG